MKLSKNFLKTELGINLINCVKAWDNALTSREKHSGCSIFRDEYRRATETFNWCQAQWEVYQLMFKQLYKTDFHFSRTDEYFGIVSDNNSFLYKVYREE